MKESIRNKACAMKQINDISLRGEIVVFGSTYMSKFPLYELLGKCTLENAVYNRSIEGLTVEEALEIVKDCVINIAPSKIFISLGEEDEEDSDVIDKYSRLVTELRSHLPESNIYLIGLTGKGKFEEDFNKNIKPLCNGKKIKYIEFVSKQASETALYRARFKQLSYFFRNRPVTAGEAFAIASV